MYALTNGYSYIGVNSDNVATSVSSIKKALLFCEKKKASNYRDNLKSTLRKFNWQVVWIGGDNEEADGGKAVDNEYLHVETELEKSGFDISKFFSDTIKTVLQLRDYAGNMGRLEQEYDKEILDVRHYIRDENIKLNAIQMQKIGYFLQQLERERYECKSNRLIAEIFLPDFNNLENINCMEEIRSIKGSKYNPRILTYEMLDEIAGRKRKNDS